MKGFSKKVAFGIPMSTILVGAGITMISAKNANEMFIPIVFVLAFGGGIILWLILNYTESQKRREDNFRRKNK